MNTNVLDGMRCPMTECRSDGPFVIHAECAAHVHDDGIEHSESYSWEPDKGCQCCDCNYIGIVRDFMIGDTDSKREAVLRSKVEEQKLLLVRAAAMLHTDFNALPTSISEILIKDITDCIYDKTEE